MTLAALAAACILITYGAALAADNLTTLIEMMRDDRWGGDR